jgi:hypothetical protein
MLLLTAGIIWHAPLHEEFPLLTFCDTRFESLRKNNISRPSRFAITKGIYMEVLPEEFRSLLRTKLAMTALT